MNLRLNIYFHTEPLPSPIVYYMYYIVMYYVIQGRGVFFPCSLYLTNSGRGGLGVSPRIAFPVLAYKGTYARERSLAFSSTFRRALIAFYPCLFSTFRLESSPCLSLPIRVLIHASGRLPFLQPLSAPYRKTKEIWKN